MILRRLLDAFHGSDFGKNLLEEPGFIQKFEGPPRRTLGEKFGEFFAKALRGNLVDLPDVAAYGPKRGGFDFEAEARRKSHCAHHAEFVFCETALGLADGSNDFRFEVRLPADEIEHFFRVV